MNIFVAIGQNNHRPVGKRSRSKLNCSLLNSAANPGGVAWGNVDGGESRRTVVLLHGNGSGHDIVEGDDSHFIVWKHEVAKDLNGIADQITFGAGTASGVSHATGAVQNQSNSVIFTGYSSRRQVNVKIAERVFPVLSGGIISFFIKDVRMNIDPVGRDCSSNGDKLDPDISMIEIRARIRVSNKLRPHRR